MKELTREMILGADDCPLEKLEVPEWDGVVYIKPLTSGQAERIETIVKDKCFLATIASWCACNKAGEKLFTHKQISELGEKSVLPMKRIFEVVMRISKIDDEGVDEEVKN